MILMPLAKRLLAVIGDDAGANYVDAVATRQINDVIIGEAIRWVVTHPSTNLAAVAPRLEAIAATSKRTAIA